MTTLFSARALMGLSLGFHIIYVAFGIGMPLMLMLAEGLALKPGREIYHVMARRWVRPLVVLFTIGAVSGTILSFELGLLWPRFMAFGGAIIGIPFSMEGFAFFLEAIFLGLYIYGEGRLSRRALFLCTIPIVLSSMASAVFVISANSWMNTPAGFTLSNGAPVAANLQAVSPLDAFANPAWLHEALHGTLATYVASTMAVSGVYALAVLRGHQTEYNARALSLFMAVAGVTVPLMVVTGDFAATQVAKDQPAKLAAMEALYHTTAGAPLIIGGWPDSETKEVHYAIEIPKLLSWLAFRDFDAVVRGLDDFPPDSIPDPAVVHPFFDLMVLAGLFMLFAVALFWGLRWRRKEVPLTRGVMVVVLLASPMGLLAQEFGWFVTEFGRLPWLARGHMVLEQGVTQREGLGMVLILFLLVYVALTAGLLWLLRLPERGGR